MFKRLLIVTFILIHGCASSDLIVKYKAEQIKKEYTDIYTALKDKFNWLTPEIYSEVSKNLNLYDLGIDEKFYLLKILTALIDKESQGKKYATGKMCEVYLNRNGKLVKENHRARGLMQVMDFNTTLAKKDVRNLYKVDVNIYWGVKIFMHSYDRANQDMITTLKNYNSGVNSNYFNWKYINGIIDDVENLS